MNQQFELKLLLKQNAQMVSKIQVYRRENQTLVQKNQDLNLWVQNLSEVFAAIGGAWKTITNNEEAMFNLMKKRGDSNSKSVISKYVSHFKTFDEIINRLGQKITNSGHSNEVTLDAKNRLNAFVQNYEMFFKEIVDSYFKFNDEYLHWITEIKDKPELNANFRTIANKELQNKLKIREFEGFMNQFRGRFKLYESQNQHKLLDGILFTKNQQINSLNQQNQKQTRTFHLILNYTTNNAQAILDAQQNNFQCSCGGIQLQYFKKEYEKHLELLRNQNENAKTSKLGEFETNTSINKEQLELIEFEKQKLIERITSLQAKIEKMKTQSRLSQDLVLNSSAYNVLYGQTQELINFIDELLNKINNHYTSLYEIEKSREEQILELKSKLMRGESAPCSKQSIRSPQIKVDSNLIEFKTNITTWIKELKNEYTELNGKISGKEEALTKSKEFITTLQKQVQELNKKIELIQASKSISLEFRHQKFNEVEKRINQLIEAIPESEKTQKDNLISLWKEFIGYVKSRDKKVKDLEATIKKKDKDLILKDKLVSVLQESLKETQTVFMSAQNQVKKFVDFIANTEKELHSLAQKNISLKSEFQQEKILMNYKLKAENEAKQKMQEKMKYYEVLEDQIKQVKRVTQETQLSYETWIIEQEKKLMNTYLQLQETQTQCEFKRTQSEQKEKAMKKIIEEKQKWRSECTKLGARVNDKEQKLDVGGLKMEIEEYKRKLMCSCPRDLQKSVVLMTCPHAFCKKCIDDIYNSRNRNCPMCGIKFGKSDVHDFILS